DQLEEIVRPVDLIHLTGAAVAHHHRRSVHAPGPLAFLAHDFFALMLGHEIRMVVVLGLVEHVFAEDALVQAGRRNGRHMVKMSGVNRLGELHGVARAFDVDGNLAGFVGTQVIDRGQVVEMIDLALEFFDRIGRDAELFAGEVAKHRNHPGRAGAPELAQPGYFGLAPLSDQEINHRALALQQFFDKAFANEAGRAGDEILHGDLQFGCRILAESTRGPVQHKPVALPDPAARRFSRLPLARGARQRLKWLQARDRRLAAAFYSHRTFWRTPWSRNWKN